MPNLAYALDNFLPNFAYALEIIRTFAPEKQMYMKASEIQELFNSFETIAIDYEGVDHFADVSKMIKLNLRMLQNSLFTCRRDARFERPIPAKGNNSLIYKRLLLGRTSRASLQRISYESI